MVVDTLEGKLHEFHGQERDEERCHESMEPFEADYFAELHERVRLIDATEIGVTEFEQYLCECEHFAIVK